MEPLAGDGDVDGKALGEERQSHEHSADPEGTGTALDDEYVRRVEAVASHQAYDPPLPPERRIVIPGYATLREFSAAQEQAVKVGLRGMTARFWSFVHWTNWRVSAPLPDGHQERVADEIAHEIRHGRLVQLLISNWPKPS